MPAPAMPSSRLPARPTPLAFPPKTPTKPMGAAAARKKAVPPNQSILSFFKRVAPPEESMFVGGGGGSAEIAGSAVDVDAEDDVAMEQTSAKRRRLSGEPSMQIKVDPIAISSSPAPGPTPESSAPKPRRGPFLDDSEEEEEEEEEEDKDNHDTSVLFASLPTAQSQAAETTAVPEAPRFDHRMSFVAAFHATKDTEEQTDKPADELLDDPVIWDDDDLEGEEFQERLYMEEQARLEAEAAGAAAADGTPEEAEADADGSVDTGCPICSVSLAGCSPEEAAVHVNACLDSTAPAPTSTPAPAPTPSTTTPVKPPPTLSPMANRFQRTAQPRPGQANPIGLDSSGGASRASASSSSAFSKLMSGHAEDAAWAAAAAAEHAARGRPAYERTCPFYKIMPGLAVCVDAFRYGAVQGCRAYFLSHFHSDHYVGLTARWCHGPIYCSRVTARLVQSQLGTAAQWVVPLDWETPVAVPGTDGVRVTMLPANHCPGSSLFLFEKDLPDKQRPLRILHCGDFRACPAHVRHPLLRPETAALQEQTIDVCYLDTTYLNPRYAFPPQDDVVQACAAVCAELDRSLRAGDEAAWHRILGRRDGGHGSGSVRAMFAAGAAGAAKAGVSETKTEVKAEEVSAFAALGKRPGPRLLVVCGTYSIGKERLCKAVAQALGSKIYATPAKRKIVAQLGDPELTALLTAHPGDAQVHMQTLMEMRGETLAAYLATHRRHFARVVGFRPSGWTYRPGGVGGATGGPVPTANLPPGSLSTATLLHDAAWRARFAVRDLVPQRGSTRDVLCFGVPYSEHSSFRELALFLLALRIERVVPTVNVGSEASRQRMKAWTDRWLAERRRGGLVRVKAEGDEEKDEDKLWDGKGGGGMTYWY